MKIVVAIDSLKGSLSSIEAGNVIKSAIQRIDKKAEICVKPLADGGEGTVDALIEELEGEKINLTVKGPLGQPVSAYYGYLETGKTAIIEIANVAGITLIKNEDRNPLIATSYGMGEMIRNACERGCRNFIIGLGGSATNDGGIGMLKALGYEFKDKYGNDVGEGGQALEKIHTIKCDNIIDSLRQCTFQIACDVNNSLYGEEGAVYVYGPQKGADESMLFLLEEGMKNYARVSSEVLENDYANAQGAGAAGGLGFAFLSYLNAVIVPGAELIFNVTELEKEIKDADIVITGEGCLDRQTVMGKAPIRVAKLAKKYNAKVIAFAGSVTEEANNCNTKGIDAFFPIIRTTMTLEEAMQSKKAKENLGAAVEQVFRLIKTASRLKGF